MGNGTQNRDRGTARPGSWHPRVIHAAAALAVLSVLMGVTVAAASAPTVTIENASEVSFASARASGEVDPADHETFYHFEYATQAQFEASGWAEAGLAGFGSLPEGGGLTPVTEVLGGLASGTVYHLRLVASNSEGEGAQAVAASTFETEAVNPPAAEDLAVSAVTASSAHFSGTVNSGGTGPGEEIATYRFECSPECPGLAGDQPIEPKDGADHTVEADATGLEPNLTYQVKLIASNGSGSIADEDEFTTGAVAPEVSTLSLKGPVYATTARVLGQVDPRNSQTTYWFEFGPADCASNPCQSFPTGQDAEAGSGAGSQLVGQDLTGLQPATTYHYRIVAENETGTTAGFDQVLTTADPVSAPSLCPNEAVRQQQRSTYLADCRAYELVTQADKNANQLGFVSVPSPDGNRIMYDIVGGAPGVTSGARPKLLAQRTASGWRSHGILPPASEQPGQFYSISAIDRDLTAVIAASFSGGLGSTAETPEVAMVKLTDQGVQTVLRTFPVFFGAGGPEAVASEDLSRVYANVPEPIAPSHQPGTANVYDFASGTPELVSIMPGTDLAPSCGVPFHRSVGGFADSTALTSFHWISDDGSIVNFISTGDDAPDCDDPLELYQRDIASGTTTLISAAPLAGDPDYGVADFLQATPDGEAVFYRTETSFDPDDDTDGSNFDVDIYRWTQGEGNRCLTCVIPGTSAEVLPSQQENAVVSEDGTHVYFASLVPLTPEAPDEFASGDAPYIYGLHDGELRFISRGGPIAPNPGNGGQLTPDGNVLIFRANAAELDLTSGLSNENRQQYYRYDWNANTLACLSCATAGFSTPGNVRRAIQGIASTTVPQHFRVVSDDGSIVVFQTPNRLVSGDVNQSPDLYEWHDGKVSLISDGLTDTGQGPLLATTSADGRDIFILDAASLNGEAQDGAAKLYDVRSGGGFLLPPAAGLPCQGEACLDDPAPPPPPLAAGSDAFGGAANSRLGRHRRKHHRKRRHHHKTHHHANHNRRVAR